MSSPAARQLYQFIQTANTTFARQSSVKAFEKQEIGEDFTSFLTRLFGLVAATKEEILRVSFKNEERNTELISRLDAIVRAVVNTISARGSTTSGPIVNAEQMAHLQSIAEQLENMEVETVPIDRPHMVMETEKLIADVKQWGLRSYAEKTMLMQLKYLVRIIQEADSYSDAELRVRVKSIIADFAAEFTAMDKQYETFMERVVRWGRVTAFAGTALLGLTADATAVAGLLTGPPKLIGN